MLHHIYFPSILYNEKQTINGHLTKLSVQHAADTRIAVFVYINPALLTVVGTKQSGVAKRHMGRSGAGFHQKLLHAVFRRDMRNGKEAQSQGVNPGGRHLVDLNINIEGDKRLSVVWIGHHRADCFSDVGIIKIDTWVLHDSLPMLVLGAAGGS